MKKELIKEIKKHTKVVLKRADEQKLEMEYPEGYEKATEEVLVKHMDQEKARVEVEMRRAADKYEKEKVEEKRTFDEQQEHARKSAEVYSATLLQGAVRKSQARKQLRERCYKVFIKEFDPGEHLVEWLGSILPGARLPCSVGFLLLPVDPSVSWPCLDALYTRSSKLPPSPNVSRRLLLSPAVSQCLQPV